MCEVLLEVGMICFCLILMIVIVMIGVLFLLVFGFEGGGFILKGLGVMVIGGLISFMLFMFIIVLIVYEFFMKFKCKKVKK